MAVTGVIGKPCFEPAQMRSGCSKRRKEHAARERAATGC
jgi:hypothetical protein